MLRRTFYAFIAFALVSFIYSCQVDTSTLTDEIPQEVVDKLYQMGFNPDGIEKVDAGYRIERDIIITEEMLAEMPHSHTVPNLEQYRTTNTVSTGGGRNITVYIQIATSGGGNGKKGGGGGGFSTTYANAVDEAISRYNALNMDLTFSRVTSSSGADISFSRLGKGDERRGVLGSAGFPSANGDPYGTINMSGVLESTYGLGVNGIATIIAHEMGHCVGLRHTDYFDRSISCGGSPTNEGASGVGAILIPGTPSGATLNAQSFMLSCTDGSNRNFNNDDQTALGWMYNGNF